MAKQNHYCCPALLSALKMDQSVQKESRKIVQMRVNTRLIEAKCKLEEIRFARDLLKINPKKPAGNAGVNKSQ